MNFSLLYFEPHDVIRIYDKIFHFAPCSSPKWDFSCKILSHRFDTTKYYHVLHVKAPCRSCYSHISPTVVAPQMDHLRLGATWHWHFPSPLCFFCWSSYFATPNTVASIAMKFSRSSTRSRNTTTRSISRFQPFTTSSEG